LPQVNKFLETIVMNPPVVSVAGFANVDRGLFRAVSRMRNIHPSAAASVSSKLRADFLKQNLRVTISDKPNHSTIYHTEGH
jgi:hypothetical protein